MNNTYHTVVVGGGFYGLRTALFLYEDLGIENILVIEKEDRTMTRASYVNQARVHNGYHYPRSILTGYRSAVNFPRFVDEYEDAVEKGFNKYYAIARHLSKVSARQFEMFAKKIGVEVRDAETDISSMFDETLVEKVYKVQEYAFSSTKLREILLKKIAKYKTIKIHTNEAVQRIESDDEHALIATITNRRTYASNFVLNCTYSNINTLHRESGMELVKLKHEITEMCLVDLPDEIKNFSVTLMDGPFFSIMPFPPRNLHTLSHVRYTPHDAWTDDDDTPLMKQRTHDFLSHYNFASRYKQMYNDVIRYIPELKKMKYIESLVDVKTVLVKSEGDDSRPILFRSDFGIDGYVCIMGGKVDNIYDVFQELRRLYEAQKKK